MKGLFEQEDRFRSVIDMRQLWFGSEAYRYFDNPLPETVQELREAFYPSLSTVANEWSGKLGQREAYPDTLEKFLGHCHEAGQTRPTPVGSASRLPAGFDNCRATFFARKVSGVSENHINWKLSYRQALILGNRVNKGRKPS